jgi:hypothetical protein
MREDTPHVICGVQGCTALVNGPDMFCPVHRLGKLATKAFAGQRCARCRKPVKAEDWIARDSFFGHVQHVDCKPYVKPERRRGKRATPLFDEAPS